MEKAASAATQSAAGGDLAGGGDEVQQAWAAHHVSPLWENRAAHRKDDADRERAHIWRWSDMQPLIDAAIGVRSMEAVERRVLSLVSPHTPSVGGPAGTTRNLNAGLQILMPGETARPHRHSMNALRFVLAGQGATTVVDGKACAMEEAISSRRRAGAGMSMCIAAMGRLSGWMCWMLRCIAISVRTPFNRAHPMPSRLWRSIAHSRRRCWCLKRTNQQPAIRRCSATHGNRHRRLFHARRQAATGLAVCATPTREMAVQ